MKVAVKIMPKEEVLDSQGRAVEETLKSHGHQLAGCRVGKLVELEFAEGSEQEALQKAKEIADFVLHNELIESYELEIL